MRTFRGIWTVLTLGPAVLAVDLWVQPVARGADETPPPARPSADALEHFEKKIRPVLIQHCGKCHKGDDPDGGLNLVTGVGIGRGGDSGAAVVAGVPGRSRLIKAIEYNDEDLQMPPKTRLPADVVALLTTWVKQGAVAPSDDAALGNLPSYDFKQARQFWSFQPVRDTDAPQVHEAAWNAHPVDRFVRARLDETGLQPVGLTDRRTLIRRATFDLTGLPPTPGDVDAFVGDGSVQAFEKVVDRLLASRAYGERWGRHWLDLARYGDTSGCNSDFPVDDAHRYRDWVIDAFNRDQPYDDFVRDQVAGDLRGAVNETEKHQRIVATGYLALSRRFGSRADEHHLTVDDSLDNLGKVFLGLSLGCARCHDHKFDPIPQKDYFALYGILDSTVYPFPGTELYRLPRDLVTLGTPDEAAVVKDRDRDIVAFSARIEVLTQESKSLLGKASTDKTAAARRKEARAEIRELKEKIEGLAEFPAKTKFAFAVSEGKAADARVHRKGDPTNLGEPIPRGFLQILGEQKVTGLHGSGRAQLATWLTDPANPLFARVMVNRIWQHHFGHGLVRTPNDFGARGARPTHPALLDHLTKRFVDGGWSMKALHRYLMLSRSYQLSSRNSLANQDKDPGNELLWRFERRRLSADELRDSLLWVSGALDRSAPEPFDFPPLSERRYTQHKPFLGNYESNRRSVYRFQPRIRRDPFFEVFDGADAMVTTPERPLSNTPLQALFLMNDKFFHQTGDRLATRVGLAVGATSARVAFSFRLLFGRAPVAAETAAAISFIRGAEAALGKAGIPVEERPRRALESYLRMLFASNEFLYVD